MVLLKWIHINSAVLPETKTYINMNIWSYTWGFVINLINFTNEGFSKTKKNLTIIFFTFNSLSVNCQQHCPHTTYWYHSMRMDLVLLHYTIKKKSKQNKSDAHMWHWKEKGGKKHIFKRIEHISKWVHHVTTNSFS